MPEYITAKEPFRFYTRKHLSELTGYRAATLQELRDTIKKVSGSCVYHHTHRFLQQHQHISPEPPNDFAYWITDVLGEDELGEKISSIDIIQFSTIRSLREKIVKTIDEYFKVKPSAKLKFAHPGEEFYFIKSVSFVLPTNYSVYTLSEFIDVLHKITIDSIYFHIFEARLRLEKADNDFSNWIEHSIGNQKLADEISRLDPYTYTLEDLRRTIIRIVERVMAV